ncbi:hypothetical protein ANCCEY_06822 [Ancylostoma ceylanicum]|uniref:Peptidase C1A papain C-terminal domain-containing protein n=1 Tax=Ancylostoma ceylanicum TaxID=53326 RepID=A0A0D6LPX0_9BILA|nr:hypothetical protein ANCCEY_06822 [Ancylostoma ceylanicum]
MTHTGGKLGGGHAVKMIGWGIEQGMPYWLLANSWNEDWGEDACPVLMGPVPQRRSDAQRLMGGIRRKFVENSETLAEFPGYCDNSLSIEGLSSSSGTRRAQVGTSKVYLVNRASVSQPAPTVFG